ncbi:hypothetical protein STEG23_029034 [Scotinomys teguina]
MIIRGSVCLPDSSQFGLSLSSLPQKQFRILQWQLSLLLKVEIEREIEDRNVDRGDVVAASDILLVHFFLFR